MLTPRKSAMLHTEIYNARHICIVKVGNCNICHSRTVSNQQRNTNVEYKVKSLRTGNVITGAVGFEGRAISHGI